MVYGNKVYDVTKYHHEHPGGSQYLTDLAGKDVTQDFDKIGHSSNAKDIREKLFVGYLAGGGIKGMLNVPLLTVLLAVAVFGLYFVSSKLLWREQVSMIHL